MELCERWEKRRKGSFSFNLQSCFLIETLKFLSRSIVSSSTMSTKMKGIYKGFKYISNIFVVKDHREMEIGLPTDVKHVAHIGWDGERESAPSWMKEYKTASDYSAASVNEFGASKTSNNATAWSSRDFEESMGCQPASEIFKNASVSERKASKKQKRKKIKSATSSPKSSSSSMSRASRAAKSKASFAKSVSQLETTQNLQGMIP